MGEFISVFLFFLIVGTISIALIAIAIKLYIWLWNKLS